MPFKTAYTGGTFSLLHVGHIDLLEYCSKLAERVVVALNTDDFVKRFKGKPPTDSYQEREKMLLSLRIVDEVIPNIGCEDSKPTILQVNPDVVVVGSDWLENDYCKQMSFSADWLEENKITLVFVPRYIRSSTTLVKERIRNG